MKAHKEIWSTPKEALWIADNTFSSQPEAVGFNTNMQWEIHEFSAIKQRFCVWAGRLIKHFHLSPLVVIETPNGW